MSEIVTKALESGLWATLFCVLFFYMLRDSRQREGKYITTIEELGSRLKQTVQALNVCQEIKNDVHTGNSIGESILSDTNKIKTEVKNIENKADAIKNDIELLCSKERL